MTNKQYHRCRRALDRLEARGHLSNSATLERAALRSTVETYRQGGLRAKNGRGTGLHRSNAAA